jgi:hypothetical protein
VIELSGYWVCFVRVQTGEIFVLQLRDVCRLSQWLRRDLSLNYDGIVLVVSLGGQTRARDEFGDENFRRVAQKGDGGRVQEIGILFDE